MADGTYGYASPAGPPAYDDREPAGYADTGTAPSAYVIPDSYPPDSYPPDSYATNSVPANSLPVNSVPVNSAPASTAPPAYRDPGEPASYDPPAYREPVGAVDPAVYFSAPDEPRPARRARPST